MYMVKRNWHNTLGLQIVFCILGKLFTELQHMFGHIYQEQSTYILIQ